MSEELSTGLEGVRESLLDDSEPMDQVAARRRLAQLAEELCLPMLPDVTDEDVSEDIIREAIADQVECVESRVPKMKGLTLKKFANRGKMVMPLYFHTPIGRETVRRLVMSGRFVNTQMAIMLGVRLGQLEDFIRGQGWDKQMLAIKREKDSAEYAHKFRALLYKGKFKTMEAAVKLTEHIGDMNPTEAMHRIHDLRALHEVMVAVDPPAVTEGGMIDPNNLYAVNVGLQIIGRGNKKFDPVEAAKKATAAEIPKEIEND